MTNDTADTMHKAGQMASQLIRQSCAAAQEEIRKAVDEVNALAKRVSTDSEAFTATLMEVGEEHARRVEAATGRLTELLTVIEQQKRAVAALCITTPSEFTAEQPHLVQLADHRHEGRSNGADG